jgi:benzil reductase ((S)-benzoin forming)
MNYYFITGTSSGIGKALAEEILKDETNWVVGLSRRNVINHARYAHHYLDLSIIEEVKRYEFPRLDEAKQLVLINNSGQIGDIKRIGTADNDAIDNLFKVNLIAPAILMNLYMQCYMNHNAERIVLNVSSGAANYPIDSWAPYCSSKAGLDHLTRTIHEEQKITQWGIKVYSIAPGIVDTEMQSEIRSSNSEDFSRYDDFVRLKEQNELTSPEAVAKVYWEILRNTERYTEPVDTLRNM